MKYYYTSRIEDKDDILKKGISPDNNGNTLLNCDPIGEFDRGLSIGYINGQKNISENNSGQYAVFLVDVEDYGKSLKKISGSNSYLLEKIHIEPKRLQFHNSFYLRER